MIATKYVAVFVIILIAERHLANAQSFQHIEGNKIFTTRASFWPAKRLDSQPNIGTGDTSKDQSNTVKPNVQLNIKQNDQVNPHITDSPESTANEESPPQSSGFWPDSKFVFKRRKNDQPNMPNVDDSTPTTQGSLINDNWQNWNDQSSDDTANQAIFIHYSGADKHKFSGKQTDQAGPSNPSDVGFPNFPPTSTGPNVWPEPSTGSPVIPINPVMPTEFGISEQEIADIQRQLANGWLGIRGIDPFLLSLLQVSPEEFEKEFGSLGSLPLPRDND